MTAMKGGAFHAGEIAIQERSGVREAVAVYGPRIIRNQMPDQHRELFERLPTLFVGALDRTGQPWATVVAGRPGFIEAPDATTLVFRTHASEADPALACLSAGAPVGLLGLEPHTRRRNRANGFVEALDADGLRVHVTQSFGNCPKYIHARAPVALHDHAPGTASSEGAKLSAAALRLIEKSDTFFIASASGARLEAKDAAIEPSTGVDISHRGGPAGFVMIDRSGARDRLTIPDYSGNGMFNTLGNLVLWPKAGLVFVDWNEGHLLHLAVDTELETDTDAVAAVPGAERLLHMHVNAGTLRLHASPFSWSPPKPPPQFVR